MVTDEDLIDQLQEELIEARAERLTLARALLLDGIEHDCEEQCLRAGDLARRIVEEEEAKAAAAES